MAHRLCLQMAGMFRKLIFMLILMLAGMAPVQSHEFNTLLYSGKWANAKVWLLTHRQSLPLQEYYIKHLQVCYFLNEQELCKAYCDSLASSPGFHTSLPAQATYHLLLSKYFQYHLKQEAATYHAQEALLLCKGANHPFLTSLVYVRLASVACTGKKAECETSPELSIALQIADRLPDSLFLYKSRIKQIAADIYFKQYKAEPFNEPLRKRITDLLYESNRMVKRYFIHHPLVAQNYLSIGKLYVNTDPEEALHYYRLAETTLDAINDGDRGIFMYLSATLFSQVSEAYEMRYRLSRNTDDLNKAIIWAKRMIALEELKQKYEGFYLYRRYIDHYAVPAEQRIASLYLTLYQLTHNTNYLHFAVKYVEYFRHKPITQVGMQSRPFSVLKQMAESENGSGSLFEHMEGSATEMISQPEYVSRSLRSDQAMIAYFSYTNIDNDSIIFFVQCIEHNRSKNLVFGYPKKQMMALPLLLHEAIEKDNAAAYKKYACSAYQLILAPVLQTLDPQVKHLNIILPAQFNKPLPFEGFLVTGHGNDFASFDYVFDHYSIGYVTSFTHFLSHRKHSVRVNQATVWNPDYSQTMLAEVTEAPLVTRAISGHYRTREIVCTNKRELLRHLLDGEILQVSAHAAASFDELERPRIYTGFPASDSVLLDIDLERLKTQTHLVVFAACKTNQGNVQHTGMIDGFTRAVLSAGAGGTICTVYEVQESVTTEMLEYFYANLAGGYNSCEALQLAKQEIKQKYPNPKVWQAYVYTGADIHFEETGRITARVWFWVCVAGFITLLVLLLKPRFN